MWYTYQELSKVEGGEFTVAAAFGNVHGVYAPGNVRLTPQILHDTQSYIKEKLGCDTDKPVKFVFHGGSGSSTCLLYTSPSPRDRSLSRMPSSA